MRARKTTVIAVIFQIFFLYANCYGIISYKTPQEARKASSRQVNHFSDGKSSDHVLVSDEDVDLEQEEYRDRCKVFCLQNNMILVIPKPLLRGADREHIRALDLNCKASENQTHFVLDVPLTGCGTNSRHSLSSVIYSNEALPAPPSARELVSHVPNFEIPFYCYYDNSGVVTGVGLRPESKKVIFSQKGFGKFSLSLELYPDESFADPYRQNDYPVTKKLREKIFFKASVDTIDDRLTILAKECYATPSQDKNSKPKYWIIHNGCKMDDTVDYIPSDRKSDKFSLETFKFIGENAFIFLHCQVRVCNASDEQSKCARVCEGRRRRDVTVSAETADDVYPLAQGPITLEKEQEVRGQKTKTPARSSGTNIPVTTMLAVLIVLFVVAVSYILCRRETEVDKYNKLIEEIRD
ncbi:ZP domain-containing protein-like [Acropora millepora]|uniref:ZP domain-containing protein-like n=1 Tax=Acropora millepora TaxID=45264 RepID=UPI001CF10E7F|nr:ZP domain-containing protein-like [Acropora millepora]